jgi:hypothetical protein
MKEVAILLLLALMLNGCSTSSTNVQTASGGLWQAKTSGGEAPGACCFSFITQFTVGGNGVLTISSFQFLNSIPPADGGCFPASGETPTGTLDLTASSANQVSGTFSFTVTSGSNTLSLNSTSVTGTLTGTNLTTLTGGSISGIWSLQGGTGCNDVSGTFTMTQSS